MTAALRAHARLPIVLVALLGVACLVTGIAPPAGHLNWALEVGPGLLAVLVLIMTFRRAPLSHLAYAGVFLHFLILAYGGHYTYANAPLGEWARHSFDWSRNHYDRVGHVALGFFPCLVFREVLLGQTPLRRGGWLTFLIFCVVLAVAAFWELLEWWVTLIVASDVGQAFLGSQGDVWDAQWDMFLAVVGAAVSLALLKRAHDRSIQKVPRPS
jgi:putative membrane protein